MTGFFFRSSEQKIPIREAVKALYPPRNSHWEASSRRGETASRFNHLLLGHGEKHIQDWAVIAYTSPLKHGSSPLDSKSPRKPGKTQWAQQQQQQQQSTPSLTPSGGGKQQSSARRPLQQKNRKIDKDSFPSVHMTKIEGRLHLCSLSIVFEPSDPSRGIVRCPFKRMDSSPKEFPSDADFEPMCVEFSSSRHIVMKTNNIIGPYETVTVPTLFRFTFLHSKPNSLVELCGKLFFILNHADPKPHHRGTPELDELLKPMLDRPFDPTNLLDVRERPLTSNLRCSLVQPLQTQPGCLVLTHERIYFQPAAGVLSLETPRATSWLQSHVVALARRYHGLKDSGVELFWKDGTSTLFALKGKHEREQIMRAVVTTGTSTVPCHTDRDFVIQASQEWQKGSISNYDYLLVLNSAAGRTMHDLSRYPVFPWVISDYESEKLDLSNPSTFRDLTKPVGALNEERLAYFRQRFESMQDMDDPFLYGTHYSAAGYVLYYLVRSMPEHMLCLQNGE
jgi:factor associated with neutral sphingomyelinase activation